MTLKSCWTCKDRKVSCDRGTPKCLKCIKSKRKCGGYGLRLTWPKQDCNRALVGYTPLKHEQSKFGETERQWINVLPTDIRLHLVKSTSIGSGAFNNTAVISLEHLLKSPANDRVTREQLAVPSIPEILCLKLREAVPTDQGLIHYFESVVASVLPMIHTDRQRLVRLLIKRAISNRSQASRALYNAVLALASYHRGDDMLDVDRFKRAALRDLYTHEDMDMCSVVEHVPANLLLCVLEMQQTSGDNSCWVGYIVGIKQVIDAVKQIKTSVGSDASLVLGWIFHFEVMARFSLRHWRTDRIKALVEELGFDTKIPDWCALQYVLARSSFARGVPNIATHAHPVIQLLAKVSETAMYSSEPKYLSAEYQLHLEDLRSQLEHVSSQPVGLDDLPQEELYYTRQSLELNRLAGLIYLERVSRNFSGQSTEVQTWVKQAVSILAELETCLYPFALFVISCELDEDEDRVLVLNLYSKMEKKPHLRSFLETRGLIQTAWNQQDLAGDEVLEYIYKINLVMSSRNVVPSLI